jgi:hypothetical protein
MRSLVAPLCTRLRSSFCAAASISAHVPEIFRTNSFPPGNCTWVAGGSNGNNLMERHMQQRVSHDSNGARAKRRLDVAFAFSASTMRSLVAPLCTRLRSSFCAAASISAMAWWKASSFLFDGVRVPEIFRTNCTTAAWISSLVAGGSNGKSVLIDRHMQQRLASLFLIGYLHSRVSCPSG